MENRIKELCARLRSGNHNKRGVSFVPNPHIDFETFAEFLTRQARKPRTIELILKSIHKFQAEINKDNIQTWRNHIQIKKNKSAAIKRLNYSVYLAMREYLEAIERKDLLAMLPDTKKVDKPYSQPHYKNVDSIDWRIFLTSCNVDEEAVRDSTITMRNIGLRVGEVTHMKVSWIFTKEKHMAMKIPKQYAKSGKDEELPIDSETYTLLQKWTTDKEKDDYVFLIDGRPLTGNDFLRVYRRIEKEQHLTHFHPHKMRHTFIHDLESKGFLLSEIQLLARHADISTTGRYTTQDQKKVWEKFHAKKDKPQSSA